MAQNKSETVRIGADAKRRLEEMARSEGRPLTTVLDEAIDHYHRETVFRRANAAYLRGQLDLKARKEESKELALLDGSLLDGLEES